MDVAKDIPSEMSPEEQRRKRRAERQAQVQPPSSGGKSLIGRLIESQKRMAQGHRRLLAAIAQAHVELMRTSAEIAVDFFKGLEPSSSRGPSSPSPAEPVATPGGDVSRPTPARPQPPPPPVGPQPPPTTAPQPAAEGRGPGAPSQPAPPTAPGGVVTTGTPTAGTPPAPAPARVEFLAGSFRRSLEDGPGWTLAGGSGWREFVQRVAFARRFERPPQVTVGLSGLDVTQGANTRVYIEARNIGEAGFDLVFKTWADTSLYGLAANWLALEPARVEFLAGSFGRSLAGGGPIASGGPGWTLGGGAGERELVQRVAFARRFERPPQVTVGLSGLDALQGANTRVYIEARNVREEGFDLVFKTWADTSLYGLAANWLALEPARVEFLAGSFGRSLEGGGPIASGGPGWTLGGGSGKRELVQRVAFARGFERPPQVTVGLSGLDALQGANTRADVEARNVSEAGFDLVFRTWADTHLYGLAANWLALEPARTDTPTERGPEILGVGTDNGLWYRNHLTSAWVQVPNSGSVIGIAVMPDGKLLGIGMNKDLWYRDTLNGSWRNAPNSGSVIGIVVEPSGRIIGIGTDHCLWTRDRLTANWSQVPNSGSVTGITILPDGKILGVGTDQQLYYRTSVTSAWNQVPNSGSVIGIAALPDGKIVGIGTDKELWVRNDLNSAWGHIPQSGSVIAIAYGGMVNVGQFNYPHKISLKSWKGDYLHRPDQAQGVTTWGTGVGNEWIVEPIEGGKVKLKSWKGDYLHRPDQAQGVTTWGTGVGNEWVIEPIEGGKVKLKSWKGDYLHRPDQAQGVTTWSTGVGNEWVIEPISGSS